MTPTIESLLRQATVRVEGKRPGAGFFVSPGVVVTCVHVVGPDDSAVRVGGQTPSRIVRLSAGDRPIPNLAENYPDVAFLWLERSEHPCVALDDTPAGWGDDLQTYGYPDEGGTATQLTPARLSYRGIKSEEPTPFIDLCSDTVKPGMSGGALCNLRTGAVCGVVVATRNAASPDGGLAVPWDKIGPQVPEVVEANRRFHETDGRWSGARRRARSQIRFRIPRVVNDFAGRGPELMALEQALASSSHPLVTQSITGLGGVGKTQLVARYVKDHLDEFDIVAWVRAENAGVADLAKLAETLGVGVEGLSPEERAVAALEALERTQAPWLLVLDNVNSPEDLARCAPAGGDGQVIVTSRHRGFERLGPTLRVDVFDVPTASAYLLAATKRKDVEGARVLAVGLGGLPLALSHAAAFCSETGKSFESYLDLLEGLPAAELFDRSPESFYQQTVASTWRRSMAAAGGEADLAPAILATAACLAPDDIPTSLFAVLLQDQSPRAAKRLADGIGALSRYSMAEVAGDAISVHRLVQKVVRDASADDSGPATAALSALEQAWPTDTAVTTAWPTCERLLSHVLVLTDTAGVADERAVSLVTLRNKASAYLIRSGGGQRTVRTCEGGHHLAERLLGPEHPTTLSARANLAVSYSSAGRTAEAVAIQEQVAADSERLLGREHPDTVTAWANLAGSYSWAGRTDDAIVIYGQVVADRERLLGPEHPATLTAWGNLASSYWSAGRTAEALAIDERVVADRERLLGPEHTGSLIARANLASCYRSAGRTAEAIVMEELVVVDSERLHGPEHPATLTVWANLASSYWSAGRTAEALAIDERVVADSERLLGPEHPDTVMARSNLASSYWSAGRTADGLAIYEQMVADRERLVGPEHPDTLTARAMFEQVVADSERILGPEHPATLNARANLALSYHSAGRTDEAIAIFELVVIDSERLHGPEHPDTLSAKAALDDLTRAL